VVQPQWVFDCVNARSLLPAHGYRPGVVCPAHLSPFGDGSEGYSPSERVRQAAAAGTRSVRQGGEEEGGDGSGDDASDDADDDGDEDEDEDEDEEDEEGAQYEAELSAELTGSSTAKAAAAAKKKAKAPRASSATAVEDEAKVRAGPGADGWKAHARARTHASTRTHACEHTHVNTRMRAHTRARAYAHTCRTRTARTHGTHAHISLRCSPISRARPSPRSACPSARRHSPC